MAKLASMLGILALASCTNLSENPKQERTQAEGLYQYSDTSAENVTNYEMEIQYDHVRLHASKVDSYNRQSVVMVGYSTWIPPVLYMEIGAGNWSTTAIDTSFSLTRALSPGRKAAFISDGSDSIIVRAGAYVFEKDSVSENAIWGRWKTMQLLSSEMWWGVPVGEYYGGDSLMYLIVQPDSTWQLIQKPSREVVFRTNGRISKVITPTSVRVEDISESLFVYEPQSQCLAVGWKKVFGPESLLVRAQ